MRIPIPRLYLGTMTFGWTGQTSSVVDESVALEMMKHFIAFCDSNNNAMVKEQKTDDCKKEYLIDTARIYAGGKTETILGKVLSTLEQEAIATKHSMVVGTKANPAGAPGGLSKRGMEEQLKESLKELKRSSVGEYYLHQPDPKSNVLESLQWCHDQIMEGSISCVGMSNYHAQEMERVFHLCTEHNLHSARPKVYQGLYNPLNRWVEEELLPILKANQCSFVAYNPLAAGLLSGKHAKKNSNNNEEVLSGRFKDNVNYLPRFYTEANFEAVDIIRSACEKEGITMIEATYRWLLRHSALTETDGVLIGASSVAQLDENLQACSVAADKELGILPSEVLQAFDKAWGITKSAGVFPYWRSYSADMPNRETMDPGASYNASKK